MGFKAYPGLKSFIFQAQDDKEFINFLATQSITVAEWTSIKQNRPEVAEQELDVFSDLVWEGVLTKAVYVENISPQHIYLFHFAESQIELIGLKIVSKKRMILGPFKLKSF